jgi:hypothetical protein
MKNCIIIEKNLQNITQYVLEFQITIKNLKPLKKGLYPKHTNFKTTFPMELVPTPITLNYLW